MTWYGDEGTAGGIGTLVPALVINVPKLLLPV